MPDTISLGIGAFLASYEASSGHSQHTIRAYRLDLTQFADHFPPERALATLSLSDVEDWLSALVARGYAPATRRRKLASVRIMLNHLARRGIIAKSPIQHGDIRIPVPDQLPRALPLADARALVRTAREAALRCSDPLRLRDRAIVEVLLSTGIRVGELVALRRSDHRSDDHALLIKGKGNRERIALLFDESSREALREMLDVHPASRPDAPLFLNYRGNAIGAQGVAYVLSRLARAAGVDREVTPHMLRHTAATLLLLNGADVRLVQDFLGHSSLVTTQLYTRLSPVHFREALGRHHHGQLLAE